MQLKDLNKLAPLIKDKAAWDAFVYLLEDMELEVIAKLTGNPTEYQLIRISGQYNLLQTMYKARDNALALEKGLRN